MSTRWLVVVAVALVARFWDLGARVMTHDESLHAYYSFELFSRGTYRHDPVYHGPLLYHLNALTYFFFGASDFTARLVPALLGTLLVASIWLFRRYIGNGSALAAAALMTISPTLLFYSRHIREDVYVALFTMLWVYAAFRYLDERRPTWLHVLAISMAAAFISKETSFIFGTIVGAFFVVVAVRGRTVEPVPQAAAAADLAIVMLTLALPFVAGFAYFVLGWQPDNQDAKTAAAHVARAALILFLFALSTGIAATRFRKRAGPVSFAVWTRLMATFWAIALTFYTGFFTNVPGGIVSGIVGSLGYWLTQQEVARAGQPWFYYGVLAGLYEFLPVVLGTVSVITIVGRRQPMSVSLFVWFLIWWSAASWALYAWAGEKMPWLLMHQILPLCLLAGWGATRLMTDAVRSADSRSLTTMVGGTAALLVLIVGIVTSAPFSGRTVDSVAISAGWIVKVVVLLAVGWLLLARVRAIGRRAASRLAMLGAVGVLAVLTLRTSLQLNFVNYDLATELMSYAQASPDVKRVMRRIEALDAASGGNRQLEVAFDDESTWPIIWYLRDYPNARTWAADATLARSAPVILVGPKNRTALAPLVSAGYTGDRHILYWWPIQDYQRATVSRFLASLTRPEFRHYLWRVFSQRDFGLPLASWPIRREFDVYVRDDVAARIDRRLSAPSVASSQPIAPEVVLQPTHVVAGPFDGVPLRAPSAIALGANGTRLIADSGNHRIVVLASEGRPIRVIGGAAVFNEPWGVGEDSAGNVFVADTWNGQVQVFDRNGAFVRKWGSFGTPSTAGGSAPKLYGPRGLCFTEDEALVIADTGNKRLLVLESSGALRREIGAAGQPPEFFDEPTAVAYDPNGTLLVADAWKQRIVRLDKNGRTIASWPVPGWTSRSPGDKPFLAVAGDGTIYASEPAAGAIFVFTPAGHLKRTLRLAAVEGRQVQPTGIAIDAARGELLVTDRAGDRVLIFVIS